MFNLTLYRFAGFCKDKVFKSLIFRYFIREKYIIFKDSFKNILFEKCHYNNFIQISQTKVSDIMFKIQVAQPIIITLSIILSS